MRGNIMCVAALLVFIFATQGTAQAEVTLKDDAVFGAESIILDVDNQKEFLRLSFTAPYPYAQVVNEFGPGGLFEGWQVASQHDMDLLGVSANIVMNSTDPAMVARTERLRDWFGEARISSTHNYVRGLVSDFFYPATYGGEKAQKAFSIGIKYDVVPAMVDYRISGYGSENDRSESIFLIRSESGSTLPGGGTDDVCDASLDVANPNCQQICLPTARREKGKACSDGIDNDCDGFVDQADPDCVKKGHGKK